MVDAMVRLMNNAENHTGPMNLGNPVEMSMLSLAEKIIAMTGSSSRIEFKPLPADDPRQRQPDISLAKRVLGWQPTTVLEAGLEKTIRYFRGIVLENR
jgi:UDP-glucuronate decarboxylase